MTRSHHDTVRSLLEKYGTTYAHEAGINLKDTPSPLYELLVLSTLLSTRISAGIAVSAATELFRAGYRTPEKMREASWQDRVDALGRGHYRRYDESTATRLGDGADHVLETYHGDLRRLRDAAQDVRQVEKRLTEFPGIGPTGAAIFLREVQGVWPGCAPYLDKKARQGAERIGLPQDAKDLAGLVDPQDLPRLAAALVRVALDKSSGDPLD